MRKLLRMTVVITTVFLAYLIQVSAQVRTVPYTEDFETLTTCGTACGAACPLTNGWVNDLNDDIDWTVDVGGTGSTNTGPGTDHNPGTATGNYLYTETSGCNGDTAHLISPPVDLSTVTVAEMSYWYHMWGATMGEFHVDISNNNGSTWTLDVVPVVSGDQGNVWLNRTYNLSAFVGDTILLRFRAITGTSFTSDMAVDDVSFYELLPLDAGVSQFLNPGLAVCAGTDPVQVEIKNFGTTALTSVDINWSINGVAQTAVNLTGISIPSGGLDTVLLGSLVSTGGTVYNIVANTTNPNMSTDGDLSNDTLALSVNALPVVNTYPYFENFDAGPAGWTTVGATNNWQLATPAGAVIIGASSGLNAWVTGAATNYANNHDGFVISPCMDMSSLNQPIVRMRIWWHSEFSWDGAVLQASDDAGTTWAQIGALGDPDNWYNDGTITGLVNAGFSGEGWSGNGTSGSGGWVTARHDVPQLANEPNVRFRVLFGSDGSVNGFDGFAFDDFELFDAPPQDAEMLALESPVSGCALGSDTVRVMYYNRGSASWNNAMLSYSVNGATPVTETDTTTLAPGDTAIFTFSTLANLSTVTAYNIDIWADLMGDADPNNDSLLNSNVIHKPSISSFPYIENFDGPGWVPNNGFNPGAPIIAVGPGWENVQGDAPQDWAIRSTNTNSFGTGPDFDHTTGSTNYVFVEDNNPFDNDSVMLVSPCFDISALLNPELSFWIHSNNNNNPNNENEMHLDIFSNGQWIQDIIAPITHRNNMWNQVILSLVPYIPSGDIAFRFRVNNNNPAGFGGHDIAIDDFVLTEILANDLGVANFTAPNSGCGLSPTDTIKIEIRNYGVLAQDSVEVAYSVNGGTPVVETAYFTPALAAGATSAYAFATTANLGTPGTFTLDAYTQNLTGDTNLGNDSTVNYTLIHKPSISAFPYIQNFDGPLWSPINTNNNAPIIVLPGGWENVQGDALQDWAIRSLPTTSGNTGPDFDHTTGSTNYLYVEDSGFENDSVMLVTPCFDIGSLLNPELSFWVHSNNNNDPNNENELHIDLFANGVWTLDIIAPILHRNMMWNQVILSLAPYIPAGDIAFRFRVNNNNGNFSHDIAIDDFVVTEILANDLGASAVVSPPVKACGLTSTEPITVTIENFGVLAQDSVEVAYVINGGTPVVETAVFSPPLPGMASAPFTFTTTANLSVIGVYTIDVYTQNLTGDSNFGNDSTTHLSEHIVTVSSYPYFEDFESGNGGWTTTNLGTATNNPWELGTPSNTVINAAASGVNAWVTDLDSLYGANTDAAVIGPCFDFSSLVTPKIEMAVWWNSEFSWDGAVLQSSIDAGGTWQNVGAFGDPDNWYNDNSINGAPGGSQEGWSGRAGTGSGGWVIAKHDLDSLGGQSDVLLRVAFGSDGSVQDEGFAFDDIFILESPGDDVGVINMQTPAGSGCGDSSTIVTVQIVNFGINPQTNIPITVNISPGTPINTTFPGPLNPGDTASVVVGGFNSSAGGLFTLTCFTALAGDQVTLNDTLVATSDLAPITPTPIAISDTVVLCIPDSIILSVVNDTSFSYTWYDSMVGGTTLASDTSMYMTPFLNADATYWVDASPGGSGTSIRLTQFDLGGVDMIEIQNLSSGPIDATGWVVAVSNAYNNINSVNTTYWNLGNMAPGQVLYKTDGAVNPWGSNLFWNPGTFPTFTGWAMILDDLGNVVDAVFWNWPMASIAAFNANVSGFTITGADIPWMGNGVDASATTGILTRTGNFDNDDATDWVDNVAVSTGVQNPQISLPFSGGGGSGGGCPSARIPVHVLVAPPVPVDLGPDGAACAGVQVDATTPGAASYLWNTMATTPAITVTTSGQYSVIITNSDGCTGADTINLLIQPSPTVNLGPDGTVCGDTLLDAGNPGASYAWSNGDQTQTSLITASGTYSVLVTNVQGCTDTDTITVSVLPSPSVDLGPDISVCEMAVLDAGAGADGYLWSNGDTTQTTTVTASGLYTVTASATNGCTDTDDIVVNILPNPTVDLGGDETFCDLGILDAGNPGSMYLWNDNSSNQTLTVTTSGNYTVTVTDGNGCEGADTVAITVEPSPVADFSWIFTSANTVALTNVSTPTGPGITYLWDFGDGNTSTAANPTHTYAIVGNYQITLKIISANCGEDSITKVGLTAIDDLFGSSIQLYPNPNTGKFKVLIEGLRANDLSIRVTDIAGKLVYEHKEGRFNGNFEHEVDLTGKAEGVYMVRITDGERTSYKKVVKE